jgi:DNA polymerase family A
VRRFTIDSSVLGTSRHIVGDADGYSWSDSVPRDSWHMTGELKGAPTSRCLDTLLRIDHRTTSSVPDRYLTSIRTVVTGSGISIPWQHVMPQDEFRKFFKNVVQETRDAFPELPFDYYDTAWAAGNRVLSALRPAAVDGDVVDGLLKQPGANPTVLEGFRPKRSGFARPVTYDRFSTRTGRLTVTDGPNILVLKKDHRTKLLRSSTPGGSIVQLDFRALEPRIVLAEAGRSSDADDLYSDVSARLLEGSVDRATVKVALIAELYGISRSTLRSRLSVSDAQLDSFIDAIRGHFGIEDLRGRLKAELAETGRIRNRFGRPLTVPAGQDNLLVNTYAQSTGVDVAMLGFDSVLRTLGEDGIRPLFVLHDALILDVRSDRLSEVMSITSVPIPSYETPFPLKPE